jgi:hypothetical protein
MKLPFSEYDVTIRDLIEVVFGGVFVIFGIVGSVIISNTIIGLITSKQKNLDDRKLNIFILCIHIIIILIFTMLITYLAEQFITNPLILTSAFNFIGPTIGISSLYFGQNLIYFVNLSRYIPSK